MTELLNIFPFINQTMIELEKQNKFLNKVTLTGKINALNVAANLFEFTDKTAVIFDELKVELIEALLQENIKKVTSELDFKAKTTIDILIRNLFERTADVGFLSTDDLIRKFLTTEGVSDERLLHHLEEYASKYSVYNEILIFDTHGNVKINMNRENHITHTNDAIIKEALNSDTYVEKYVKTDIFKAQDKTLMYAQKITADNQDIGVLCLCFKFEDELETVFSNLARDKEILSVSDSKEILATNKKRKLTAYSDKEYTIVNNRYVCVSKKTSGYQGYTGVDGWFATAIRDSSDISTPQTIIEEESERKNYGEEQSNLLSAELNAIIEKANDIIEDISDVIINGELIASKQKVYVLTPILDNLRTISTELLVSIKHSIKNLEHIVKEGLINDVKMASHLAIDIMDRNLYERANDSRWWALTPTFQEELSQETPSAQVLNPILKYINDLYTVYTNIFIYDTNKKIVAASLDHSIIGKTLHEPYIEKTLVNKNSQNYFVSNFENSAVYNNEATYIYSASIVHKERVVGGIAVVFDSLPEFQAILNDSFPSSKKGFMLFIDKDKQVISSNNPAIKTLTTMDIDDKFITLENTHSIYDFLTFNNVKYIVASVVSNGYREYKKSDNYKNPLYCLTFIEI